MSFFRRGARHFDNWSRLSMAPLVTIAALTMMITPLNATTVHAQGVRVSSPARDAGTQTWVHEAWTVKDGLPVNSVNAIIQDRTGYLWLATFDGLVRFDGVRFTVYNTGNSAELPSNRILSLKQGHDASLWLTTEQGHVVRFRDGRFTNIAFANAKPDERPVALCVDSAGVVWVGTAQGLWTVRGDSLIPVARAVLDATVTSIVQRRDGSLWVGTMHAGIFRISDGGPAARIAGDPAIDADDIADMFEDATGTLWILGDRALWRWRERPIEVKSSERPFVATKIADVAATGSVFAQAANGMYRVDSDRAVLVSPPAPALSLGIWADARAIWNVAGDNVFRDSRPVFTIPGLRTVTGELLDREGSVWIGTQGEGLHRLKPALFTTYSIPESVGHLNVYPTYVDRAGAVWIGSWGKFGGIRRIDPTTARVAVVAKQVSGDVNSFFEDYAGRMWVGAIGVYVCEPSGTTCRAHGAPELRDRLVYALYGDSSGVWAGASRLLFRYDGRSWTSFPPESGGPDATVRAFATTRDGALWMGTNGGGLARYRNGRFSRITQADGLPSDLIRSLYADTDGWLWVGTEGRGLARLDSRAWSGDRPIPKHSIVRIATSDGLFDDVIHQILEDGAGRLWMNTNRGIFWVPRAELNAFADGRAASVHSTAYSERDGMRNREGNGGVQPAGAKGADGRLWFPTQDGVVVVDPTRVTGERRRTTVVVEEVRTSGKALRPEHDSVALTPDQRDLEIGYTAPTFLEPANVRFRYRLEPYDARWVDAGGRRTAFYTKVPPGRYIFHVEANDAAGGWNEAGAAVAIRVPPRVWETGLFRWALGVALAVLVIGAIRLREARLRARAVLLEEVVDQRTASLRERERELGERNRALQSLDHAKTRFFANVSHELRTPLTLTIGPLEDLRTHAGGDPQVERWLDIALRNARRLLRLVNQILDVSKLEAGAMHLTPRVLDLAPFTRGVVAAFAPVAERKGIHLTIETVEALLGMFDADAVEKILTNLVSNAIKFTPGGGAVHVALAENRGSARLLVRDSGPGIAPEQIARVFERFYQVDESATRTQPGTGIGLSLVKELIELHGGTISVESTIDGTTFTANIPPLATATAVSHADASTPREAVSLANIAIAQGTDHPAELSDDVIRRDDVPTLLVVDDSADLRSYIRDHFAVRFRVLEAADGAEGIALARRHLPDVVLSDVMMPGTDGHELVRALRGSAETDFLSIILLTAQADDEQKIAGLEHGADEYLVKPFEMRELDVRVRNLIASRRRFRERFTSPPAEVRAVVARAAPADQAYVDRVEDAIRRSLGDPEFGVAELANAMSQDRSHLFRRVKQLFEESPSDLIWRMRIEEGARLLTEESATVTDVAYAVGFNSLSHFCRRFNEAYGVTPASYRRRVPVSSD